MKIIHRVSTSDRPERREKLLALDIPFHPPESPLARVIWLDVEETHPGWPQFQSLCAG